MQIVCPECGFARDVPEDKLPKRAQLATCPKCATKFKFRDLSEEFAVSEEQPAPAREPAAPEQPVDRDAPQQNLWDQLENQTPDGPPAEDAQSGPKPVKRMYLDTTRPEPSAETVSAPKPPPLPDPETKAESGPQTDADTAHGKKPVKRMFLDTTKPGAQAESKDETAGPKSAAEQYLGRNADGDAGEEPEVDVPFERLDAYGFFPGLFETLKRSLTAPGLFFRTMKPTGGVAKPLVYYLLMGEYYALMQLLWQFLGVKGLTDYLYPVQTPDAAVAVGMGMEAFFQLLIMPVSFAFTLFLWTGITHFFLSMVRGGQRGFSGTFRAVAYAASPLILTIVPLYGEFVALLWNFILTIIALKNVHRTSYGKIILSYVIMILSFTLFAVLLSFIAGGIAPKI